MSRGPTNRELLQECGRVLGAEGRSFTRKELIDCVRATHPERGRATLDPIIQGLTENAPGGPAVGTHLFRRIERGLYVLVDNDESPSAVQGRASAGSKRKSHLVEQRILGVIDRFDECVTAYDRMTPFSRSDQVETHSRTVRLRRGASGVRQAIEDPFFIDSLIATLRQWGIGVRGSKLVPRDDFAAALKDHMADIAELEALRIDDPDLALEDTMRRLWTLIHGLPITLNKARIVAGTKTLHHLLPDLVPPIDITWTGAFFGWPPMYFISRQEKTFAEGFSAFVRIATATEPQRLVGAGWRTSISKVIDNAIIGYCKLEGLGPTKTAPVRSEPS